MHASAGAFVGSAGYTKDPVRTIGGGVIIHIYILSCLNKIICTDIQI